MSKINKLELVRHNTSKVKDCPSVHPPHWECPLDPKKKMENALLGDSLAGW